MPTTAEPIELVDLLVPFARASALAVEAAEGQDMPRATLGAPDTADTHATHGQPTQPAPGAVPTPPAPPVAPPTATGYSSPPLGTGMPSGPDTAGGLTP